jgi:hypothetical protein
LGCRRRWGFLRSGFRRGRSRGWSGRGGRRAAAGDAQQHQNCQRQNKEFGKGVFHVFSCKSVFDVEDGMVQFLAEIGLHFPKLQKFLPG